MAFFFELAAECGPNIDDARAVGNHFNGLAGILTDGTQVIAGFHPDAIGSCVARDDDGNWWMSIHPAGIAASGVGNETDVRQFTETGFWLLERLRSAPPRYRYAMVGVEVMTLVSLSDLPDLLDHPASLGLVLSEQLWTAFGSPEIFVPFSPGYRWRPYEGESLTPRLRKPERGG